MMNTKRSSTVGQFLLVQLGLHVKLEDSSQGKTLVLVNVDRDLLHLHVSLQHLLVRLHLQQSVLGGPWKILFPANCPESVPDLLAEKVFTLLQLLALLEQPFGKIARKKDVELTLSGQSQHRPH